MGLEVFGLADLLLLANRVAQQLHPQHPAPFSVRIVSLKGGNVRLAGGWQVVTTRPDIKIDCLVVPGFDFSRNNGSLRTSLKRITGEIAFIRKTSRRGTPVLAACVGAFLLAEAGLLDERRASTAWLYRNVFAHMYPAVRLDTAEILVEDGNIVTTGALSACMDLALFLIRRHADAEIAAATGRLALIGDGQRSQAPYIDPAWLNAPPAGFASAVKDWLGTHLRETFTLEKLATAFHVSPRTLLRRFKAETGTSPLAYLQSARIERAKTLLLRRDCSIAAITEAVGYTDPGSFTQLFKREVKLTPAAYRRQFGRSS